MAIQTSGKRDSFTEINITPLTDIFLVLLIIMMVIAPMFQKVDKNIMLPSINSGLSVDEKEVTVAITKNAEFFVNAEAVNGNQLSEKLLALIDKAKDKKVVVKADGQTKKQQSELEEKQADKNISSDNQVPEDRTSVDLPQ